MKAIIFNSGLGSRLGELTARNPKCLVRLSSGETIFHRQLRILVACGIRDFVVTTGPWPEQVEAVTREFEPLGCTFALVRNDVYDQTNYLHSLWLAREELRGDDILMLHGDLVFDAAYVAGLLEAPAGSYGSVDSALPLPEKDFKARVIDGEVREVGVGTWGEDCVAFQAMYRLTPEAMDTWLDEVVRFERRGETSVYAENAANNVFNRMHVAAHSYTGHVLEEIDTSEDLTRVSAMIRARDFADQPSYLLTERSTKPVEGSMAGRVTHAPRLGSVVVDCGLARPLVVVDAFLSEERLRGILGDGDWLTFSGYTPNPTYGQALAAVRAFRAGCCDSVVSVGGGSAIDIAKCVRLWAHLPGDGSGCGNDNPRYCDVPVTYSVVRHIAIPTTAGTGSESTHFAVVYVDGEKRSVAADCLQPDVAALVPDLLAGIPDYQRKATMLDALCQAIESHWSASSSEASRAYTARAIPMIMGSWEAYLAGDSDAASKMHLAANLAGRAINLTTTTLAHAMSYKLTSLYGIAHGHAVALCLPYAWRTLAERGNDMAQVRLRELEDLGIDLDVFEDFYRRMGLSTPVADAADLDTLATSVNAARMDNYPVELTTEELREAYRQILGL